ncbi:hypothetical protein [Streptomyces sp. 142MFCol3.1]|uniref:hypothetical protein n=1 Tax=Streptomyces sp. 142MFCol3.1 TaxID=1172179 RepID=UPI0003FBA3C7|nr:hypothetical protein [Streptomyces sp. 142MFCol3.1]
MTAGWCSRTVRAAMFAAVCVLLAALGHVMMSGSDVPAWVLAAGALVTGGASWCLTGRERGLPSTVAAVVAAQTGLHSAFSFAQSATGGASSPGHDMGSMQTGSMQMRAMDSMDMGHMESSMTGSASLGMVAAHLLAALLCGLWLAYGERAAFRILRAVAGWLAAPLRLLLALPLTPERRRIRARRRSSDRARRLLLAHAITSRGPPVGAAVA